MAKLATLKDEFNGVALRTDLWSAFTAGSATLTYSAAGASCNFPASSTSSTDGDITSIGTYDLTDSYAVLNVTTRLNAVNADCDFAIWATTSANELMWQIENGTLFAIQVVASSQTNLFSVTWNSVTHAWLRIRESNGITYWETAPNGLDGEWVVRFSKPNPITLTSVKINIGGVAFGADTSAGSYVWRNFNITSHGRPYSYITAGDGISTSGIAN